MDRTVRTECHCWKGVVTGQVPWLWLGDNEIIKAFIPEQEVHLQVCQLIKGDYSSFSRGCLRQASAMRSAGTCILECKRAYYLLTLVDLKWRLSP